MTGNGHNSDEDLRGILADTVDRLLADHITDHLRHEAEQGRFPATLWRALVEAGLTDVLVSGAGGVNETGWREAVLLMRAGGAFGLPAPFAETVLAGWILSSAGLEAPSSCLTVAGPGLVLAGEPGRFTVSGTLPRVPWGRDADSVVSVVTLGDVSYGVCAPVVHARVARSVNLAREPRDTLLFDEAPVIAAPAPLTPDTVMIAGALARASQMAGALDRILALTVRYAGDRIQFGRPIAAFQAVQQALAVLATQTAAAGMAVEQAAHAMAALDIVGKRTPDCDDAAFAVAVAKTRADDAAGAGAAIAHQIHGAIGFTYEHELQFSTRRLWSWRAEFGSGAYWAARLGRAALDHAGAALWPWLVAHGGSGTNSEEEKVS